MNGITTIPPLITVLLPIYNSRRHLKESVASIQAQTFPNWNLLAINEFGSDDGSADLIRSMAAEDPRIQLIQNTTRLGLAESLNLGIRIADGKYIARMDADDIAHPERFEKQAAFLEAHPEIALCGSWQHHFGPHTDWIHRPAADPAECRANLLFDCDLCHSTLMLRKQTFLEYHLFYDSNWLAEDFELWSRAASFIGISNIPEVLGEYRWDGENISAGKIEKMAAEHSIIVAKSLERNLKISVKPKDYELLEGWRNPFAEQKDKKIRRQMYARFQALLIDIYNENQKKRFYDEKALLNIIAAKWRSVRYMEPRNAKREVSSLEEIFNPHYRPDYRLIWRERQERNIPWSAYVQKVIRHIRNQL